MRKLLITMMLVVGIMALTPTAAHAQEYACGWWVNNEYGITECGSEGYIPVQLETQTWVRGGWGYYDGVTFIGAEAGVTVWCPFFASVRLHVEPFHVELEVIIYDDEYNVISTEARHYVTWGVLGGGDSDMEENNSSFCNIYFTHQIY